MRTRDAGGARHPARARPRPTLGGGRKPAGKLTPQQLHDRDIDRAWRCGCRYSACTWIRRAPPRMRSGRPGAAGYGNLLLQQRAFYAGYDAATRARIARARSWAEPWMTWSRTRHVPDSSMSGRPCLAVENIVQKARRRPPTVVASFCPFCGGKYPGRPISGD